jgi:ABC-2 type transport system ATP-binding protein
MHMVEELCDRIMLINKGRDVLYGSLQELQRQFSGNEVLVRSTNTLPTLRGAHRVTSENHSIKLTLNEGYEPQQILAELIENNVQLEKFEIAIPSLDDIFIQVVKEGR